MIKDIPFGREAIDLKLTLFDYKGVEECFPADEYATYTILYGNKKYIPPLHAITFSRYFRENLEQKNQFVLNIPKFPSVTEAAFDIVMRILYGFKDVMIPEKELLQVYFLIEFLGIDNDKNFKQNADEQILKHLSVYEVFEAMNFDPPIDNLKLINKLLEIMKSQIFKELLKEKHVIISQLSNNGFKKLCELYSKLIKEDPHSNQLLSNNEFKSVIEGYYEERQENQHGKDEIKNKNQAISMFT